MRVQAGLRGQVVTSGRPYREGPRFLNQVPTLAWSRAS